MDMTDLYRQLRSAASRRLGMRRLASEWRSLIAERRPRDAARPPRRLVIVPSDARTLVGARGDQAMMLGAVGALREHEPELQVAVLTATEDADAAARAMGFAPLRAWTEPFSLRRVVEAARGFEPDAVVALGADVMDGYYSPHFTAAILYAVDALARDGAAASVFGFSFNERPVELLRPVFAALSPATHLHVRDRVSMQRFRAFTSAPATLVADVAFLLQPADETPRLAEIRHWIGQRRAAGDRVLGFNMHPQLLRGEAARRMPALIERATATLAEVADAKRVSWLLLAHDFRGRGGDDMALEPIARHLGNSHRERVLYPREPLDAAELKTVAGALDGVVAGRMHLAIATLGQGVPVACLTYQDKFHGLFDHFGLPHSLLLAPDEAAVPPALRTLLERLLDDLEPHAERVRRVLPCVQRAAALNLQPLLERR